MKVYIIKTYLDQKDKTKVKGFKLIDIDAKTEANRVMKVSYEKLKAAMQSKKISIENAVYAEPGIIRGKNYSLIDKLGKTTITNSNDTDVIVLKKVTTNKEVSLKSTYLVASNFEYMNRVNTSVITGQDIFSHSEKILNFDYFLELNAKISDDEEIKQDNKKYLKFTYDFKEYDIYELDEKMRDFRKSVSTSEFSAYMYYMGWVFEKPTDMTVGLISDACTLVRIPDDCDENGSIPLFSRKPKETIELMVISSLTSGINSIINGRQSYNYDPNEVIKINTLVLKVNPDHCSYFAGYTLGNLEINNFIIYYEDKVITPDTKIFELRGFNGCHINNICLADANGITKNVLRADLSRCFDNSQIYSEKLTLYCNSISTSFNKTKVNLEIEPVKGYGMLIKKSMNELQNGSSVKFSEDVSHNIIDSFNGNNLWGSTLNFRKLGRFAAISGSFNNLIGLNEVILGTEIGELGIDSFNYSNVKEIRIPNSAVLIRCPDEIENQIEFVVECQDKKEITINSYRLGGYKGYEKVRYTTDITALDIFQHLEGNIMDITLPLDKVATMSRNVFSDSDLEYFDSIALPMIHKLGGLQLSNCSKLKTVIINRNIQEMNASTTYKDKLLENSRFVQTLAIAETVQDFSTGILNKMRSVGNKLVVYVVRDSAAHKVVARTKKYNIVVMDSFDEILNKIEANQKATKVAGSKLQLLFNEKPEYKCLFSPEYKDNIKEIYRMLSEIDSAKSNMEPIELDTRKFKSIPLTTFDMTADLVDKQEVRLSNGYDIDTSVRHADGGINRINAFCNLITSNIDNNTYCYRQKFIDRINTVTYKRLHIIMSRSGRHVIYINDRTDDINVLMIVVGNEICFMNLFKKNRIYDYIGFSIWRGDNAYYSSLSSNDPKFDCKSLKNIIKAGDHLSVFSEAQVVGGVNVPRILSVKVFDLFQYSTLLIGIEPRAIITLDGTSSRFKSKISSNAIVYDLHSQLYYIIHATISVEKRNAIFVSREYDSVTIKEVLDFSHLKQRVRKNQLIDSMFETFTESFKLDDELRKLITLSGSYKELKTTYINKFIRNAQINACTSVREFIKAKFSKLSLDELNLISIGQLLLEYRITSRNIDEIPSITMDIVKDIYSSSITYRASEFTLNSLFEIVSSTRLSEAHVILDEYIAKSDTNGLYRYLFNNSNNDEYLGEAIDGIGGVIRLLTKAACYRNKLIEDTEEALNKHRFITISKTQLYVYGFLYSTYLKLDVLTMRYLVVVDYGYEESSDVLGRTTYLRFKNFVQARKWFDKYRSLVLVSYVLENGHEKYLNEMMIRKSNIDMEDAQELGRIHRQLAKGIEVEELTVERSIGDIKNLLTSGLE